MKKLLGIVVLGLLWCGTAYTDDVEFEKEIIELSECAEKLEKGKILHSNFEDIEQIKHKTYTILFLYKGQIYEYINTNYYHRTKDKPGGEIYQYCEVYILKK